MYNDPACFANGIVNHNVLVVGYNLAAPVPFWILRNSWGAQWGDGGYMSMAITAMPDPSGTVPATAGVCGIYTSPALYPVVRGERRTGTDGPSHVLDYVLAPATCPVRMLSHCLCVPPKP